MKKLEVLEMERIEGGAKQDFRAGAICGAAIIASIGIGIASGGVALVAMLGGAAAPVCGFSAASLFYP